MVVGHNVTYQVNSIAEKAGLYNVVLIIEQKWTMGSGDPYSGCFLWYAQALNSSTSSISNICNNDLIVPRIVSFHGDSPPSTVIALSSVIDSDRRR
jgi:hypothetical protein